MPTISVIVPVYKVENYIHRCIDSILNQTYRDFELILVDDGSPDKCGAICDEYAAKDERVVVIHQENGGLSAARNAGIDWVFAHSDSEWLTFIDSDDLVYKDYLLCLYEAATRHKVKLSQCGEQGFYKEEEIKLSDDPFFSTLVTSSEIYTAPYAIVAVRKLIHRDLMSDLRFPVGKLHEDEHTMYRIIFSVESAAIVHNANFYFYRLRDNSIMHSSYSLKRLDVLDAYEAQLAFFLEKGLSEMYCLTGSRYLNNLVWQYKNCRTANLPRKKHILRNLRFRTIHLIIRFKRKLGLSFSKTPEIFNIAFPGFMFVYWGVLAQVHKFKNRIDNA